MKSYCNKLIWLWNAKQSGSLANSFRIWPIFAVYTFLLTSIWWSDLSLAKTKVYIQEGPIKANARNPDGSTVFPVSPFKFGFWRSLWRGLTVYNTYMHLKRHHCNICYVDCFRFTSRSSRKSNKSKIMLLGLIPRQSLYKYKKQTSFR
jgi:hypothetical protein